MTGRGANPGAGTGVDPRAGTSKGTDAGTGAQTGGGTRAGTGAWWRWLTPGCARHESGIPVDTDADALVFAVQPLFTLAVVILTVVTMRPLGLEGWGLVGTLLLAVNGLIMLSRSLPDAWIDDRTRLAVAVLAAPLAGSIWAFDPSSWAEAFAFVLVVHAGVRFEPRVAVAIAAFCAGTAVAVLAARHGQAGVPPWWVGGAVLLITPVGLLRRSRRKQLATANELVVQTRRVAVGEVRAELARDLHDVLAHSLSGVNMQLSLADALFEAGRIEQGREALQTARTMVVDGLGEARRAVSVLRQGTLELVPALQAMITGANETFTVSGTPRPIGDDETHAFIRVAQEALTNARRHAPGAVVQVRLSFATHSSSSTLSTRLEVRNPAPPERRPTEEGGGMGLVGMRERAAAIGAELTAGPVTEGMDAGGWSVTLELER